MAVSFPTTTYIPSLQPQARLSLPPPSCSMKHFSRLKSESLGTFGAKNSNLTVEFYSKVSKSIEPRCRNHASFNSKDSRRTGHRSSCAQVRMMPIGTPKVPYRTPGEGTWQWVDLWNALYRERVIFIGENIDEEFSNQVLGTMLYLDTIDSSRRLYMYINGPGGDLTPSMAIYDTMRSLKSPIGTHCIGYTFNMASFLLAAGEKGHRFAMPLSRIALQSPAGSARGQADDIRNEANELLRIRDYLFRELAEQTGQPVERINEDLRRQKRFSSQEALEYGLIDRVVRPPRIKADAPRQDAGTGLG